MGNEFSVNPAALRRSGEEMAAIGAGLDARWITLDSSIWGRDEEGATFGDAYSEVANAARTGLASIVEELASIGDRLAAMAQTHEHTDKVAHDAFGRIMNG